MTSGRRTPWELSYWRYKMYLFRPVRGSSDKLEASCVLRFISFGLPRRFVWKAVHDTSGAKRYVDLLGAGRKAEASAIEAGFVEDIEYDPEELKGTLRIDAEAFFSAMALRGHVDLPLVERLTFVKAGRRIAPRDFLLCLGKYSGHPEWYPSPDRAVDARPADVAHLDPSGSMYAPQVEAVIEGGDSDESDDRPPSEIEVARIPQDRYFELVTRVTPARGQPYFARRLARYDGALIWAGTSYQRFGPWTESHRDNASLLAFGVQM